MWVFPLKVISSKITDKEYLKQQIAEAKRSRIIINKTSATCVLVKLFPIIKKLASLKVF